MTSDALLATRIPKAVTRTLSGALVGACCGFLIGFLMSSYTCHDWVNFNCYPTQVLKMGLLTAAGVMVGLIASRLWRSMTNKQKIMMTAATLVLLVVLVLAGYNRINPWSCNDSGFCQNPNGPITST